MAPASDSVLLQRLIRSDPSAWREIVEQYSGLLMAVSRRTFLAYGYLPASQDCEDVVAEVWCNLLEKDRALVRRCLQRGYFLPTLHVLARNRTIDTLRRRKFLSLPLNELDGVPRERETETAPDRETVDQLTRALGVLSAKERTLIELFFLQGKKYREITVLAAIPQNSIGPTIARALVKLRRAMADSAGPR